MTVLTRAVGVCLVVTSFSAAGIAFAGSGVGGVFNLGKTNKVNAQTSLLGKSGKSLLHVVNKGQGSTGGAIGAVSAGGGATIGASNNGSGPAAAFNVAASAAPFTVSSNSEVANLNAQFLQGDTPASFYPAGSKVADSQHADVADSAVTAASANNSTAVDNLQVRAFSYDGDAGTGVQQFLSLGGLLLSASCSSNSSVTIFAGTTEQNAYARVSPGAAYSLAASAGPVNLNLPNSGGGIATLVYSQNSFEPTSYSAPVITVTFSYEQRPINRNFCQAFGTAVGAP